VTGRENTGPSAARWSMTFIVRVSRDEAGRLAGVVERVRTGQKERFQG
jgi:hypothetical protein